MDESAKKVRKSQWMNIIQQWSASGLTKTEWCRRNNISPKSFFYWQRQLRQEAYCQHIEQNAAVAVTAAAKPAADPTKTGYTFANWYADEGLGTAFDFTLPITADTTVFNAMRKLSCFVTSPVSAEST